MRITALCLSAALWASAAVASPPADNLPSEEEKALVEAVRAGRIEDALKAGETAAKKKPQLGPAPLQIARVFLGAGRRDQARAFMERAATENPESPEVISAFGQLALAEGRVTDALSHLEKLDRLLTADAAKLALDRIKQLRRDFHSGRTSVAELRRDWKTAEVHLNEWLKLDAKNGRARQGLARALFFQDRPDEAAKQLEQAFADDDKLELPAITMGRFYTQKGADGAADAKKWMDKALTDAKHGKSSRVRLAYADWLFTQGKAAEAKPFAAEALAADSRNVAARRLVGLIARFLKDHPAAISAFDSLLLESPGDAFAANQLALTLLEQGTETGKRRAVELAELNARQYQQAAWALGTLGWIYYKSGRLDDAEKLLGAAVQTGQADADILYFFANVLFDRNRTAEVKKILEAITKAPPGPHMYREDARKWLERLNSRG